MVFKKLIGKKCYLSPLTEDLAEVWYRWFNDLEVTVPLGDEAYIATTSINQQEALMGIINTKSHVFSIVTSDENQVIGRGGFMGLENVNRKGSIGIVIGEKRYWNKGFGTDAMSLLVYYGFMVLNLNNIMLGVFEFNKRAMECYKKIGFKEIGRRREARIINNKNYDAIYMDILREEFDPLKYEYIKPNIMEIVKQEK
jgi:RimJ/RimL family protein N-acetyltransferase